MNINNEYLIYIKKFQFQTIYNCVNSDNHLITINHIHTPTYENISFTKGNSYDDAYNRFKINFSNTKFIFDLNMLKLIESKDILNHKLFIEIFKIKFNESNK